MAQESLSAGLEVADAIQLPLVYVLVLNYCSRDDTLACVETIRAQTYTNVRLLVIDNASPDESGAELARQLPPHEFLQLPENIGYAGGNNEGIKRAMAADPGVILILNPDVRLPAESISHYQAILQQDPSIGALNAVQVGADGYTIDPAFSAGVLAPAGYKGRSLAEAEFSQLIEVATLYGAAIAIPRHALERVGGFDPLFFAYGEETDLCRRLKYHGYRLVVTPTFPVVHLRTKYADGVSGFVLFLKVKGFYLCKLKDPTGSFPRAFSALLWDLSRALIGRAPNAYPFKPYTVPRTQLWKALGWLVTHALAAWRHKQAETKGRVYV